MTRPTDETLMAYADGNLDGPCRRAIERYLLGDAVAQRFVHTMTLVTAMTRQAYADQDFTRGLDHIVKQIERGSTLGRGRAKTNRLHSAWWIGGPEGSATAAPWFAGNWFAGNWFAGTGFSGTGFAGAGLFAGTAVAAIGVALLALAVIPQQDDGHPTAAWGLSLGKVKNTSTLHAALNDTTTTRAIASSREFERYQTVSDFKDKFGNMCRELDAFDNHQDPLPAAVVVACRGPDKAWSVLGVVATRSSRAATYAADAVQAHDAMAGVLEMLGANRRTSGLKSESEMR